MNFIFVSPHFPENFWNFCDRLNRLGVRVLGIGDAPYDCLDSRLKSCLTEYYFVGNMEDYNEMYRAVAFFAFKYGRIDWIESNNEYWLENDARLRSDFNIKSGIAADAIAGWKNKFDMKKYYDAGNIPTARCHKITTKEKAQDFVNLVGFPVIVKPDNGVGAHDTWKLSNNDDFDKFFCRLPEVQYIMEEFIAGDIYSYDAITDSEGNPLFESSSHFPPSMSDIVLQRLDLAYWTVPRPDPALVKVGRATLKAFGVKSRFTHFEFFKLSEKRPGLGNVGDFVGLEVNMRPAGGYTPDMMNFANDTDVYQIWADMVANDKRQIPVSSDRCFCVNATRRDIHNYVHSTQEIFDKYKERLVMCERLPQNMWSTMGNTMFLAKCRIEADRDDFLKFVLEKM